MSQNIHRQALHLTLLEDCVLSERNATEGGHRGLDRIPGQTLLGAAAARLYGKLAANGDDAYTAFHSGRVRFIDGLPSDGDAIAYPVPLALHKSKSGGDDTIAYNFASDKSELPDGTQPKQMREGYVFPDGHHVEPARNLRMKTAIDPKTGHAAEAQLFGYESLARGQTFIAWVEADDTARHLLKPIVTALQGEVLLGRSRSAEYGQVRIEPADGIAEIGHGPANGKTLTLWLLSDLALVDELGRPTLQPTPQALGLADSKILWHKTFLRHRRYSPWNAYRHGYDRERLLLTAGGVITLKLTEPPTAEQLERLEAGIGLYREAGLGRLWIEPPLLAKDSIAISQSSVTRQTPTTQAVLDDPLLSWLEDQTLDWRTESDARAKDLARDIGRLLNSARRRHGIRDSEDFGPSKSQWGQVLETARDKSGQALHDTLFAGDSAVIKAKGDGWGEIIDYDQGEPVYLADWLSSRLAVKDTKPTHYAYLIRRLAHRLRGDTRHQTAQQGEHAHG
jgi:hypothetical protein